MIRCSSLTFILKVVDFNEEVDSVLQENLVADLEAETFLSNRDSLSEGDVERPAGLVDLFPGRWRPQFGPDEAVKGGEQPLGTDGLQKVRDEVCVRQGGSVLNWNLLEESIIRANTTSNTTLPAQRGSGRS